MHRHRPCSQCLNPSQTQLPGHSAENFCEVSTMWQLQASPRKQEAALSQAMSVTRRQGKQKEVTGSQVEGKIRSACVYFRMSL
jgi:hypothetical protein